MNTRTVVIAAFLAAACLLGGTATASSQFAIKVAPYSLHAFEMKVAVGPGVAPAIITVSEALAEVMATDIETGEVMAHWFGKGPSATLIAFPKEFQEKANTRAMWISIRNFSANTALVEVVQSTPNTDPATSATDPAAHARPNLQSPAAVLITD